MANGSGSEARPDDDQRELPRAVVVLACVAALGPLLAAVATRSFRSWTPTQDLAVIDLRVRDVFTANTPLTGPYSRYGWSHLGPFEFWTVGAFARLFGRPSWATLVGHVLLQLAPLTLSLWLAARWNRRFALVCACFIALSYGAVGRWMVLEPWNPHVAYAYWVAFLVLVWMLIRGRLEAIAPAAFIAAALPQLHVGFAPIIAGPAVLTAFWIWRDHGSPRRLGGAVRVIRAWPRALQFTCIAIIAMWVPVVIEQVVHSPGNLRRVAAFFADPPHASVGFRTAAAVVGEGFALPPNWWGRPSVADGFDGGIQTRSILWLGVAIVLFAVAAIATRFMAPASRRWAQRLLILDVVLVVSGVVAIARITDVPAAYLFYWRAPLAIFVWLTIASIVWTAARERTPAPRLSPTAIVGSILSIALIAVILVRIVPATAEVATAPDEVSRFEGIEPIVQQFLDEIANDGLPTDPVKVLAGEDKLEGLQGGIFDGLDRLGVDVRSDPSLGYQFGYERARSDGVTEVWYAIEGGALATLLPELPGARTVASTTPLSPEDDRRLQELHLDLVAQLVRAGNIGGISALRSGLVEFMLDGVDGLDSDALAELAQLNARLEDMTCRCAVIGFPIDQDPQPGTTTWDRTLSDYVDATSSMPRR